MHIRILGSGQDAGIPQIGCSCSICQVARNDSNYWRFGPSIAVIDDMNGTFIIIDASPDLKYQLEVLREMYPGIGDIKTSLKGILLTHAHFGHCFGLWHLGRESLSTLDVPVFCTSRMKLFMEDNYPFDQLVRGNNIKIIEVADNREFEINGVGFNLFAVPHRNEVADTVGYVIDSGRKIGYFPDVDYWTRSITEIIKSVDIALLDGTFYTRDELDRFDEVPHPPVLDTIKLLGNVGNRIIFTHINHTNPLNLDGRERKYVESRGFDIASDGMIIEI
ncbi:MAG: MBL fold metallo-hydrolase [Candidatus Thermoplasmatota archaeon]|nr:MBL fold metallo-hydrolase [Candidatus Thermoplasmatota archaeon]